MQGNEIASLLSLLPSIYYKLQGIFYDTDLPPYIYNEHYIIILKQKHWLCMFRHFDTIEAFDSLAFDYTHWKPKIPYKENIVFNTKRYQSLKSKTCGLFVVTFLIFRIYNLDLEFYECLSILFTGIYFLL